MLAAVMLFCLLSIAAGSNVTITASSGNGKDKYCLGSCYNTAELVFSDNKSSNVYIMFDLESLPQTATIGTAMLLFRYKGGGAGSFLFADIYPAATGWNEDDDQQPDAIPGSIIGSLNNISCGDECNNEDGWFGIRGDNLISTLQSWISGSLPNNGFIINDSSENFSAFSSEAGTDQPFLYIEYESSCDDLDGDGFGVGDCLGKQDCDDANASINPNATEVCNNIDDDCDGVVDDTGHECTTCSESDGYICNETTHCSEDYLDVYDSDVCCPEKCVETCLDGAVRKCGLDIGACTMGYSVCDDSEWGTCRNETPPVHETCNNIDDDCDGIVDNTDDYLQCQCYNSTPPSEEVYDNIDNDCDGIIDEDCDCTSKGGYICSEGATCPGTLMDVTDVDFCCSQPCNTDCTPGQTKVCGTDIGACSKGTISCIGGKWGNCTGAVYPGTESCNDIDDDCDGIVDDINGSRTVEQSRCGCTAGGNPFEELCNKIDDDCDGSIDESCTPIDESCTDNVMDFDELGVDCGGSCIECSSVSNQSQDQENESYGYVEPEQTVQGGLSSPLVIGGASVLFIIAGILVYLFMHKKPAMKGNARAYRQMPAYPSYPSVYRPRRNIYMGSMAPPGQSHMTSRQMHRNADSIRQRIDESFR